MGNLIVDLPGERWKPIAGFESLYAVSGHGRIKSLGRIAIFRGRWGVSHCSYPARLMSADTGVLGHKRVPLRDGRGGCKRMLVHRLVLAAFVGPCPEGMEACHNDGDPTNNRVENLRWDTKRANQADRASHGTAMVGERHYNARLYECEVREIRRAAGVPLRELAAVFGVGISAIKAIRAHRIWRSVQ